jgi:hypothetical protein
MLVRSNRPLISPISLIRQAGAVKSEVDFGFDMSLSPVLAVPIYLTFIG